MFLLVPAHLGSPGAVKQLLLLLSVKQLLLLLYQASFGGNF